MKTSKHKITFQNDIDAEACALAKLGVGNKAIARHTGLTECQITYRLSKLKRLEGQDDGYRVQWRNGNSPVAKRIIADMQQVLVLDIQRNVTPRLIVKDVANPTRR